MSEPRSAPPHLDGLTFERGIGGGGFADVFLYQRHRPARKVAVKVLRREHLSETMLRQFEAEADVMAQVSAHPYIVTIFGMGVAPDGRPFIEMEHYPNPHYGLRARDGGLSVEEVLRVGIQVSGAVETAHRAGILHRDIKPANILTSAYGRPGLADFGIASVGREGTGTTAAGLSVAFAPPEAIRDESSGSPAGDVYSLAVTLATMLSGSCPFLRPGVENPLPEVVHRVLRGEAQPITRADVPDSLRHLLAQGRALDPSHRPPSAVAFGQALQDIERELQLSSTALDVETMLIGHEPVPASGAIAAGPDLDGTRDAAIQVVSPDGNAPRSRSPLALDRTDPLAEPVSTTRSAKVTLLLAAVLMVLLVVGGLAMRLTSGSGPPVPTSTTVGWGGDTQDPAVVGGTPRPPAGVRVERAAGDVAVVGSPEPVVLLVSWRASGAATEFQVRRTEPGATVAPVPIAGTSLEVTVGPGERPCFEVVAVVGSRPSDPSDEVCFEGVPG